MRKASELDFHLTKLWATNFVEQEAYLAEERALEEEFQLTAPGAWRRYSASEGSFNVLIGAISAVTDSFRRIHHEVLIVGGYGSSDHPGAFGRQWMAGCAHLMPIHLRLVQDMLRSYDCEARVLPTYSHCVFAGADRKHAAAEEAPHLYLTVISPFSEPWELDGLRPYYRIAERRVFEDLQHDYPRLHAHWTAISATIAATGRHYKTVALLLSYLLSTDELNLVYVYNNLGYAVATKSPLADYLASAGEKPMLTEGPTNVYVPRNYRELASFALACANYAMLCYSSSLN